MLYRRRTFTKPAGAGSGAMCQEKGHSATDARGKCLCCGETITSTATEEAGSIESEAYVLSNADPLRSFEPVGEQPLA